MSTLPAFNAEYSAYRKSTQYRFPAGGDVRFGYRAVVPAQDAIPIPQPVRQCGYVQDRCTETWAGGPYWSMWECRRTCESRGSEYSCVVRGNYGDSYVECVKHDCPPPRRRCCDVYHGSCTGSPGWLAYSAPTPQCVATPQGHARCSYWWNQYPWIRECDDGSSVSGDGFCFW
jgi:hypothetical protein